MLSDILDGYFPYDLKGKYPDGVVMKIIDHTEEAYDPKTYEQKDNVRDFLKMDEQFRPYTKEEFLKQLPEQIIKNGKIIPVRADIGKRLGVVPETESNVPQSHQLVEVETHVVVAEKAGSPYDKEDISTVKIRTEKGARCLVIKLLATDKVSSLYKYAAKYR